GGDAGRPGAAEGARVCGVRLAVAARRRGCARGRRRSLPRQAVPCGRARLGSALPGGAPSLKRFSLVSRVGLLACVVALVVGVIVAAALLAILSFLKSAHDESRAH